MDQLDIASEYEERHRLAALSVRRPTGPAPTGRCLECGEVVEEGRRWCPGVWCRDLWERVRR
jgi:hypothetical protein